VFHLFVSSIPSVLLFLAVCRSTRVCRMRLSLSCQGRSCRLSCFSVRTLCCLRPLTPTRCSGLHSLLQPLTTLTRALHSSQTCLTAVAGELKIEPATFRFVAQCLNHCATACPPPQQKLVPGLFPGGKDGRCLGLTTLPPSCANCLEIWEPQTLGSLRICQGQ
jgi:hypothetical protein